ncbi:hypothetical protein RRU01S_16_00210 [Agrobacterium rubi TR3 = NBRC 13261]|uniref:Uncharacterized protein n=1 Tax=Agrobacterium rubi TR3 = NBRC 13261 TaxID=1368415 RepID=A0A081CX63_9HYPH|nr:hypothetical protein [Agrobacterium rubi]GAK71259.1 hypothetical protein RRU01S_16_00210 [Agrobacterium rubi TR3 = NBRC 13261]
MKTKNHGKTYDQFGKTDLLLPRLHRPYASMNWIRFNGSLRALAVSQPLAGTPLVNVSIRNPTKKFVKRSVKTVEKQKITLS